MNAKFDQNLEMYVSEAEFFERVLLPQLNNLDKNSHVVEIGAGIGALALKIASHGFEVTAFEPQSAGFNQMYEMRKQLMDQGVQNVNVDFRDDYLDEKTQLGRSADLVLAVNVIEHVPDFGILIDNALKIKSPSGSIRIICPNYAIPYEPHFEIPTFFLKQITFRAFRKRIEKSNIDNPIDFWHDLSWPSQRRLQRLLTDMNLDFEFSREAFSHYIDRALEDKRFTDRKGAIIGKLIWIYAFSVQKISSFIPLFLTPIIDCHIYGKKSDSNVS